MIDHIRGDMILPGRGRGNRAGHGGGAGSAPRLRREIVRRARALRWKGSLPEVLLRPELRRRPQGSKFRRQHPARRYVLDFHCTEARLAIEMDKHALDGEELARLDRTRSRLPSSHGVATLRILAEANPGEVAAVVARMVDICEQRRKLMPGQPLHPPLAGPSPQIGGNSAGGVDR